MKNKNLQPKICNLFRIRRIAIEQHGFSLVELLISMAIASIVGLAGYVIFSSSNWSYKVQEDVSEAQQNVRVAMERFAGDVRTAGFGLPDPPFSFTFTNLSATSPTLPNPLTSPVTVTNSTTGPDTITILGIGYEAGELSGTNASGQIYICYEKTTNDEKLIGADSKVVPNRQYISVGGAIFITLDTNSTDTGTCNGAGTAKLPLSLPATLDRAYQAGTVVYIIQAVQYTIATDLPGCSNSNPCLVSRDYTMLRGGSTPGAREVLAENIEDIQFAHGIDESPRDGKIDYSSGYDAADFSNDPTDDSSIIAVRANIVAKTRNQDPKGATGFKSQCFEDRPVDAGTTNCTGAVSDGYRRRTLTKIMKLRNPKQGA